MDELTIIRSEPSADEMDLIPSPRPPVQEPIVQIDDSQAEPRYANFCRLTGSPEELLMDFGLNLQPVGHSHGAQNIAVTERIITGWHVAKRLLHVLQITIQRHEAAFGELEVDVNKRVSSQ